MKDREYIKSKKEYLKYKKWCMENLNDYLEDKKILQEIESGNYPSYMLHVSTKEIKEHTEKIKTAITLYEIITQLVKERKDYGYDLITKTIN